MRSPRVPWWPSSIETRGVHVHHLVFGIALWLYLEDVYWASEGRSSIDVAIVCAVLGMLVLFSSGPFDSSEGSDWALAGSVLLHLPWCALVAGIRLARPNSPWGRRFYAPGSAKLVRAQRRAARWDERRIRWLDRIGGAPSLERPRG